MGFKKKKKKVYILGHPVEIQNRPFALFFSITSSHALPRVSHCTCSVGNGIKAEVVSAAPPSWSFLLDGVNEVLFCFQLKCLIFSLCSWYCRLLTETLSHLSFPINLSPSPFIHPPPSSSLILSPGAVRCRSGTSRLTCSGRWVLTGC